MILFLRWGIILSGAICEVLLRSAAANFLPAPWNRANFFFATVVIMVTGWSGYSVIWLAAAYSILLEMLGVYTAGEAIVPIMFGVAAVLIVARRFFTNRSWYSAGVLAAGGVISAQTITAIFFIRYEFQNGVGLA